MSSNMDAPGALSVVSLSKDEKSLFIDYLMAEKPDLNSDLLEILFGDKFLMILDAFAGNSVKFPNRDYLEKIISYIKIYSYCKMHGFSNDSYDLAAKIFKRRRVSVVRIVDKVNQVLITKEE